MISLLSLALVCLASRVRAQLDNSCSSMFPSATVSPTTISSCTLFFTPTMPPQIAPTSTVYASMMTMQLNVVNCKICQISQVSQNPMPTGSFTTKVTSDYLLITEIGCIPSSPSLARRHEPTPEPTHLFIRGAKPQTFTPVVKKNTLALPELVGHFKRQTTTNPAGGSVILTGEASRLIEQLFTATYAVGVINSGVDLGEMCLRLGSANAILDLARVGLNATQAAAIVCDASLPEADLNSFNLTLIASAAVGLYGVQLAANFTGTVDAATLCNQLDLSPLPRLGVDVDAVESFVCGANNATTNASTTAAAPTNVPSAGTLTLFPFTNSSGGANTWFGSGTGAGSSGTAITVPLGTGLPPSGTGFFPTVNATAVAGSTGLDTAGFGTGTVPTSTANVTVDASRARSHPTQLGTAPFPTGTTNVSAVTGAAGSGTSGLGAAPFPTGAANSSVVAGSGTSGTAQFGTAPFPTGTANVSEVGGSAESGAAELGTGVLSTRTVIVGNDTAALGPSNPPAATGNAVPVSTVNGTGGASTIDAVGGAGTVVVVTVDATPGYASSAADSLASPGGYGEETSERVPRGPTSTPRYYPKYF